MRRRAVEGLTVHDSDTSPLIYAAHSKCYFSLVCVMKDMCQCTCTCVNESMRVYLGVFLCVRAGVFMRIDFTHLPI